MKLSKEEIKKVTDAVHHAYDVLGVSKNASIDEEIARVQEKIRREEN